MTSYQERSGRVFFHVSLLVILAVYNQVLGLDVTVDQKQPSGKSLIPGYSPIDGPEPEEFQDDAEILYENEPTQNNAVSEAAANPGSNDLEELSDEDVHGLDVKDTETKRARVFSNSLGRLASPPIRRGEQGGRGRAFSVDLGKREVEEENNEDEDVEKRRSFSTSLGKRGRSFSSSLGKRGRSFSSSLGKRGRSFSSSLGKRGGRSFSNSLGKRGGRAFSADLGKRQRSFSSSLGKRADGFVTS